MKRFFIERNVQELSQRHLASAVLPPVGMTSEL